MKMISSDMLAALFAAVTAAAFVVLVALSDRPEKEAGLTFTPEEISVISSADSVMRVLTVNDSLDLSVLRDSSVDFSDADLATEHYRRLAALMVSTMTDPSQDGVGIAAPQVGINRRVVAVQRFDKEGEPVEVYPCIRIISVEGVPVPGREGCLSIPGHYGTVLRYPQIVVSYKDIDSIKEVTDTISGYTSVIFQHETDHLDGILYTDKVMKDSLFTVPVQH